MIYLLNNFSEYNPDLNYNTPGHRESFHPPRAVVHINEQENVDHMSQLDFNNSFTEWPSGVCYYDDEDDEDQEEGRGCLNDVMTRMESPCYSSSRSSAASLWEDDDFAMEATNRVCEIFDSIEQLLYTGLKSHGMPERVVTECDDWRLIFPQLRLEGNSGTSRTSGYMDTGGTNDLSSITSTTRTGRYDRGDYDESQLLSEGVIVTEPMSSRKRYNNGSGTNYSSPPHLSPSKSGSEQTTTASVSIATESLIILGMKSPLYDFPKLVRSFDDFTHSTIPLTYEQMVEQIYVQDGNVEELIAFDQQDTMWCERPEEEKEVQYHVPRKKSGIPPVTPFPFRSDEINRHLFQTSWREVTSTLSNYMELRIAGLTSAALRDLMVSPESNPLLDKFLQSHVHMPNSQPMSQSYMEDVNKSLKDMTITIPTAPEDDNNDYDEEEDGYDDLIGVESRAPSTVENFYTLPRKDMEGSRRASMETGVGTTNAGEELSAMVSPFYTLQLTRSTESTKINPDDMVITNSHKNYTNKNRSKPISKSSAKISSSNLNSTNQQPTMTPSRRKSRIFSGITSSNSVATSNPTKTEKEVRKQDLKVTNNNNKCNVKQVVLTPNNNTDTFKSHQNEPQTNKDANKTSSGAVKRNSLSRNGAIKHSSHDNYSKNKQNNNPSPPSSSESKNSSSDTTLVEASVVVETPKNKVSTPLDEERKPMIRYSDTAPAEGTRPNRLANSIMTTTTSGLPNRFEGVQKGVPFQGPLIGKATRIYSKQKAGVFKTPASTSAMNGENSRKLLSKSNSSRRKNALYYV